MCKIVYYLSKNFESGSYSGGLLARAKHGVVLHMWM